jgi:hypothetical protein
MMINYVVIAILFIINHIIYKTIPILFNRKFQLSNFKKIKIVEFNIQKTILYVNLDQPKVIYYVAVIPIKLQLKLQELGYELKLVGQYEYENIPCSYLIRSFFYYTIIYEKDLNYDSTQRYLISKLNFLKISFINTFLVILSFIQLQIINTSLIKINFLVNIENIHFTIKSISNYYNEFNVPVVQDNITLREAVFRLQHSDRQYDVNKLFDNKYIRNENYFFNIEFLKKYFELTNDEVQILYSYLLGYHDDKIQQLLDTRFEILYPQSKNEIENERMVELFQIMITPLLVHVMLYL